MIRQWHALRAYSTKLHNTTRLNIERNVEKAYLARKSKMVGKEDINIKNDTRAKVDDKLTKKIHLLARSGHGTKAFHHFQKVRAREEKIPVTAYNACIDACAKAGLIDFASEIKRNMKDDSIQPTIVTFTTLISAYGKAKKMETVFKNWNQMKAKEIKPNVVAYNTIIGACASNRMYNEAVGYFQEMVSKDLRPSQVTMNAMMNACSKAEKPDEAEALFERMKKNDIPRSRMSYHTLMDAHARTKNKDRVFELVEEMKKEEIWPDTSTYGVLLFACQTSSDYQAALKIFEEMKGKPNIQVTVKSLSALMVTVDQDESLEYDFRLEYGLRFYREGLEKGIFAHWNNRDQTAVNLHAANPSVAWFALNCALQEILENYCMEKIHPTQIVDFQVITGWGAHTPKELEPKLKNFFIDRFKKHFPTLDVRLTKNRGMLLISDTSLRIWLDKEAKKRRKSKKNRMLL